MIFHSLPLKDAYLIDVEKKEDIRGYFARLFCEVELAHKKLPFNVTSVSVSHNSKKNTLRGLHYQAAPYEEEKIVYCIKGAIFDVIVDLRNGSSTKGEWFSMELSAEKKNGFYIPKGFAHGFQTLCDNCEVLYLISAPYSPEHATGVRWNDPALSIPWPYKNSIISERDQNLPLLNS